MLMFTCIKQAVVIETIDREPEGISFPKVQFSGAVISHNEWEHRKLHEVIEGPASQFVQLHQILKVGNLTLPPAVQWEQRKEERMREGERERVRMRKIQHMYIHVYTYAMYICTFV